MSVAGIASSLCNYALQTTKVQSQGQQIRNEFQQLGKDLQAGNLSAAQADVTALEGMQPSSTSTSGTNTTSPMMQMLQQLGSDLKTGDLTDAQQIYSSMTQKGQAHHGHHMHGGAGLQQDISQLGQDLQSGNLTAAQQAYASLQQELQQYTFNGVTSPVLTATGGVSAQV